MKYILEIPENKTAFAEEFFKSVSFIKNVKMLLPNEITNAAILKSIEDYESKNVKPIPFNLAELKAMIDAVPTDRQEQAKNILKQLFPPVEWAFGGMSYSNGFEEGWYRELRACSENVFDRYFHFALPQGDLSQSAIDRLLDRRWIEPFDPHAFIHLSET